MTFFGLLYDIFLHFYFFASLPKLLFHYDKYKGTLNQRLGLNFPKITKNGKKLIWIHAVSLGETKAVLPVIKRLKLLPNPPLILLSSTTKTGQAEALKNPQADFHVYFPFDFSYIIASVLKRISPDIILLTETDFWYRFQNCAKKKGIKLLLINGKISHRSCARLSKLPFLAKHLLGSIDHFYLQSNLYQERFLQLKIPLSKMTVTGNLKFDSEIEMLDSHLLKKQLGLLNNPVLTLGSTHEPEEIIWIRALKQLLKEFPRLEVLLVPRHPERFEAVAKLFESEKISFSRWSQGGTFNNNSFLLVDSMGILRTCYQITDFAFVGGSFTPKIGGHNILEPAFYGKPVLFGPYMHAQPDLLNLVCTNQAGLQITQETLIPTMQRLLSDPILGCTLGENGKKLISFSRGALDKTFNALLPLLQNNIV